jgi:UrcA family protein
VLFFVKETTMMKFALCAAGTLALALAGQPASAQTSYGGNPTVGAPSEEVIITAPRYHAKRNELGAQLDNVSLSRDVSFTDLDLRTDRGAHILRERVKETARTLCYQLDTDYLVTEDNSPPCYSTAVRDALGQADAAIRAARRTAYNE